MTSSLPDFSSSPASAPANDAASLAALFPASGPDNGSASGSAPEFDTLMGASSGPSTATVPEQPAGASNCPGAPTRLLADPIASGAGVPVDQPLSAFGAKVALTVSTVELASAVAPLEEPAAPREITRDMLEEAAAFAATLLQAALPGVQLPELLATANQPAPATAGAAGNPTGGASAGLPDAQALADAQAFTLAADGALELKLDLALLKPVAFQLDTPPDQSVSISAELQRPGEVTVRLEASSGALAEDASSDGSAGTAIFAAKYRGVKITAAASVQAGERNFVFAGDKQVKATSPVAGISVAKTETTMPVALIEEPRFARNPESFSGLTSRAEFQVVVPPAERITVPADAPAGQNFAERAVDTVTSLAEAQFNASMQKSGSVQLRLRFGGEDLNVRVEMRDGAVHTDFRTDSPELRSALTHEWQAVAAQSPEQMRRYLEPVFSPARASADTPSSFTRQQQQSQQDQSSRAPRDSWADANASFSRRSTLTDSFIPEPAASRGPAFVSTSLRLSVLA